MAIILRQNVFETNSSSTHSITIVAKEDFKDWIAGRKYFRPEDESFIDVEGFNRLEMFAENRPELLKAKNQDEVDEYIADILVDCGYEFYITYQEWEDNLTYNCEVFDESKSFNGVSVTAFGYYGYDC